MGVLIIIIIIIIIMYIYHALINALSAHIPYSRPTGEKCINLYSVLVMNAALKLR